VNRMTASHGSNTSISATALYPSSTNEKPPDPPDSAVKFDADDVSNLSLSSDSDSEDDEPPEPPLPKDPIQGWPQLAMGPEYEESSLLPSPACDISRQAA
jgi:hypothetical protein